MRLIERESWEACLRGSVQLLNLDWNANRDLAPLTGSKSKKGIGVVKGAADDEGSLSNIEWQSAICCRSIVEFDMIKAKWPYPAWPADARC
jgi:hypothetical protein